MPELPDKLPASLRGGKDGGLFVVRCCSSVLLTECGESDDLKIGGFGKPGVIGRLGSLCSDVMVSVRCLSRWISMGIPSRV